MARPGRLLHVSARSDQAAGRCAAATAQV